MQVLVSEVCLRDYSIIFCTYPQHCVLRLPTNLNKNDNQVPIIETLKTSIHPNTPFSAVDLTHYALAGGLAIWQQRETSHRTSTIPPQPEPQLITHQPLPHHAQLQAPEGCCTDSLPISTIAMQHGTHLTMIVMPVVQGNNWSFHLPLHRFAAACLREVVRRPSSLGGRGRV